MEFILDYTFRNIALGSAILGIVSGVLGCFAVLRKQGLLGDALSHATLPGICLAFLITQQKAPLILMIGASVAGWLALLLIQFILRQTRIDSGAALGTVLTTFFGLGVVLLTVIQNSKNASQAGLNKFLFGQAAALTSEDVSAMAWLGAVVLLAVIFFFKEFKSLSFDPIFTQVLGLDRGCLGGILTALLLAAIVLGLKTVGVVLMSAMLVAPAIAARQLTSKLSRMIWLAALIGSSSGVIGAYLSFRYANVATGPTIVLILALWVILALVFREFHKRTRREAIGAKI